MLLWHLLKDIPKEHVQCIPSTTPAQHSALAQVRSVSQYRVPGYDQVTQNLSISLWTVRELEKTDKINEHL